ncbi:MAG: transcription termination/antitermination protein NusG [Clostridiales bacterium]|nr:transcription termination/antitermination protein NusG [Clostridiales bacterium]MBR3843249.1 transcription termination/antitermination protein NusG [Christensenellaceae bacterium]
MAENEERLNAEVTEAEVKAEEKPAQERNLYIKQEKTDKPYWYVVYTYSGYENKVKANLMKTVENQGLQDTIFDVKVPMEESIEVVNGKKKHVQRKLFPGYVMVKMFLTDDSWYVVRNTSGVTGFVGPGSKPIPLSDVEVRAMGVEDVPIKLDIELGDNVIITSGPFESFVGIVSDINTEKQKIKVIISMFGRDTNVELDFVQVKRI